MTFFISKFVSSMSIIDITFVGIQDHTTDRTLIGKTVRKMLGFNMVSQVSQVIATEREAQTAASASKLIVSNILIKILKLANTTLNNNEHFSLFLLTTSQLQF